MIYKFKYKYFEKEFDKGEVDKFKKTDFKFNNPTGMFIDTTKKTKVYHQTKGFQYICDIYIDLDKFKLLTSSDIVDKVGGICLRIFLRENKLKRIIN